MRSMSALLEIGSNVVVETHQIGVIRPLVERLAVFYTNLEPEIRGF